MSKNLIGVLAFLGIVAVFLWIRQLSDWLNRTGYDDYVLYAALGSSAVILHTIAFVKFGWRAILSPILPVYFVIGVFAGIIYITHIVIKITYTSVGLIVLVVLSFGFGLIVEKLNKKGKSTNGDQPSE